MSLFTQLPGPEDQKLAQKVYEAQLAQNPRLASLYDERQKKLMHQDILYNISYLRTAMILEDEKIFVDYAVWLYELLCSLMPSFDRDTIMQQMIEHYDLLQTHLGDWLDPSEKKLANLCLQEAKAATTKAVTQITKSKRFLSGRHVKLRQAYLDSLLYGDTRKARQIIQEAARTVPLAQIYEDILQEVMHEVGELWHQGKITIDKEHYCTSVTQMALSQFYDLIFEQPRKPYRLLVCSVGGELHEMGGRMVADLFEYSGWDSVYLGAGVPLSALLHAVQEQEPHLVALSVTMPQHLIECEAMVRSLRENHPRVKVAVGGRAFDMTRKIWQKWPVDYHAASGSLLVEWAEEQFHE